MNSVELLNKLTKNLWVKKGARDATLKNVAASFGEKGN